MLQEIIDKVIVIMSTYEVDIDFSNIEDNDVNLKDLGVNSISFIKILVKIEDEFGIEFNDEELDINNINFKTLRTLANYIMDKLALL